MATRLPASQERAVEIAEWIGHRTRLRARAVVRNFSLTMPSRDQPSEIRRRLRRSHNTQDACVQSGPTTTCSLLILHSFMNAQFRIQRIPKETLVFADEFDIPLIDSSKWIVERRGGNDQGTPRAELQYHAPDAVKIESGVLRVIAERRMTYDPKTGATLDYTSGRLQSRQTFLYGRFEFRAKLPRARILASLVTAYAPATAIGRRNRRS
jgi:hypothetical protein